MDQDAITPREIGVNAVGLAEIDQNVVATVAALEEVRFNTKDTQYLNVWGTTNTQAAAGVEETIQLLLPSTFNSTADAGVSVPFSELGRPPRVVRGPDGNVIGTTGENFIRLFDESTTGSGNQLTFDDPIILQTLGADNILISDNVITDPDPTRPFINPRPLPSGSRWDQVNSFYYLLNRRSGESAAALETRANAFVAEVNNQLLCYLRVILSR